MGSADETIYCAQWRSRAAEATAQIVSFADLVDIVPPDDKRDTKLGHQREAVGVKDPGTHLVEAKDPPVGGTGSGCKARQGRGSATLR